MQAEALHAADVNIDAANEVFLAVKGATLQAGMFRNIF